MNAKFLSTADMTCFDEVLGSSDVQLAADQFYCSTTKLLDTFYPTRTITVTNKDPSFMTGELKYMMRKKNKLSKTNRVEEAGAISNKIGTLITNHNRNRLKSIASGDSKSLWKQVNNLTSVKRTGNNDSHGLTANILNDHYASLSTDANYQVPVKKKGRSHRNVRSK